MKKYAVDERGQLNTKTRLLCGLGAGVRFVSIFINLIISFFCFEVS